MDVNMERAAAWVDAQRKAGTMTGLLPVILWATGAALKACPRLASFRLGRRVYSYHSIDVAFTARGRDGRLFTPVVRKVDERSLNQLVEECPRLTMALYRAQLTAEELTGGCLTVSVLDQQPVLFHVGLQNAYQSAVLTVGAIREAVVWSGGQAVPQPTATFVLSYDHGLMDGWEAASALDHIRRKIQDLQSE